MIKTNIPTFGDLYFEKEQAPQISYTAIIENYQLQDATAYLKISCVLLDENTVEKLSTIISQLDAMHSAAKKAYLDDFNDEEENNYISNIYRKLLSEKEFELLKQETTIGERLLFALNVTFIEINIKKGNISTTFKYVKGYELEHNYEFNENCELKKLIFQPLFGIVKEQLYGFIDKWELPEVNEICGRFRKDWQNYPVKSYFIYLLAGRINNYLKELISG